MDVLRADACVVARAVSYGFLEHPDSGHANARRRPRIARTQNHSLTLSHDVKQTTSLFLFKPGTTPGPRAATGKTAKLFSIPLPKSQFLQEPPNCDTCALFTWHACMQARLKLCICIFSHTTECLRQYWFPKARPSFRWTPLFLHLEFQQLYCFQL